MKRKIVSLILVIIIAVSFFGCTLKGKNEKYDGIIVVDGSTIKLNYFQGDEIDICPPEISEFFGMSDENAESEFLVNYSGVNLDYINTSFEWETDLKGVFYISFSENSNMQNAYTVETSRQHVNRVGVFVPGKTYYWQVKHENGEFSNIDYFTVKDNTVRILTSAVEGGFNIRDLGGYQTGNGTVKYGMLYRGGKLENVNEKGISVLSDELHIKTEIDLRNSNDDGGQQSSLIEGVNYVKASIIQYTYIYPGFKQETPVSRSYDANSPKSIKKIFEVLADEENYPVYIHCNAGADRTGTLSFLLNGLLGVDFSSLTKDFELTSFSGQSRRWRSEIDANGKFTDDGVMEDDFNNYVAWNKMYDTLMQTYPRCNSLSEAIEKYLTNVCKIDNNCINTFKRIMLK